MSEQDIFTAAFRSRHISRRLDGGTGEIRSRLRLSHVDSHPRECEKETVQ
jgi:hypothetical protein